MTYLYSFLIVVWAALFTAFFLSNPSSPEKPIVPSCVNPNLTLAPKLMLEEPEKMSKEAKEEPENLEFVPLKKDDPLPHISMDKKEEIKSVKTIEDNIRTLIENRLVAILVKVNIAACKKCTDDDKKTILQLKMAKALTEGKVELAQYYSMEMNKYMKLKKGKAVKHDP